MKAEENFLKAGVIFGGMVPFCLANFLYLMNLGQTYNYNWSSGSHPPWDAWNVTSNCVLQWLFKLMLHKKLDQCQRNGFWNNCCDNFCRILYILIKYVPYKYVFFLVFISLKVVAFVSQLAKKLFSKKWRLFGVFVCVFFCLVWFFTFHTLLIKTIDWCVLRYKCFGRK